MSLIWIIIDWLLGRGAMLMMGGFVLMFTGYFG